MNSKERLLRAFNHEEVDRVPLDFWASDEVWKSLQSYLSCESREDVLRHFHIDLRQTPSSYLDLLPVKKYSDGSYMDMWGVIKKDSYGSIDIYHPLESVSSLDEIEKYQWPSPENYNYGQFLQECEGFTHYAVCSGPWSAILYVACELMGMENFLIALIEKPEIAHLLLDKITDFYYQVAKRMFEKTKNKIDIFFIGDDYGAQNGLLISLSLWRRFMAPRLNRLISLAKNYGYKVMLHSCGSVRDLIPDLIQLGVDILDPIQVRAKGMKIEDLKRDFGENLSFHGSIDTQHTLPFGSSKEVKIEVIKRLTEVAPGGGFCLAPSQVLLPEIPLKNIITMYEVAYQYGWYGSLGERR